MPGRIPRDNSKYTDPHSLGGVIRTRRLQRGWAGQELAAICGISPSYLSRIELNRIDRPDEEALRAIARELDLSFGMLWSMSRYPGGYYFDEEVNRALSLVPDRKAPFLKQVAVFLSGQTDPASLSPKDRALYESFEQMVALYEESGGAFRETETHENAS